MTEVVPPPEDEEELLDRIDALRVLRADSDDEKGRLLEEIAGTGKVEQEIVSQLSKVAPLWKPAQFDGAHRMAMRSLEVLDRNGARAAHMPRIGPLKPIGLPKILLGGAFLSGIFSRLSSILAAVFQNAAAVVVVAAAVVAVFLGLAWVALYSAAIARRRIRLCTDQPIKVLWDTIGAAGDPPKDQSVNFVIYAIVLLVLAAIIIPVAVGLLVNAL